MQYFNISTIYQLMGGDGVAINDSGLFRVEYPIELRKLRGESHERRKALIYESMREYDPLQHRVTDRSLRPDRTVFKPTGEKNPITGEDILQSRQEPVSRSPIRVQKYIIGQKASFARGNGVKLKPSDADSEVFKWVYSNWYKNKTDYDLRDTFEKMKAESQCAIVFFADAESIEKAKKTKDISRLRLRHKLMCPSKGSFLYPYFDPETESLVALMREYTDMDGQTVYDVYLEADKKNGRPKPVIRRFKEKVLGAYTEIVLPYPKLPVVYWGQDYVEMADTSEMISEMEGSFNDFCDQQGYSADPILFGRGKTLSLPAKGRAGKFVEGSEDADLKFVTPENATESREMHFELLQKWIFSLNRSVILDLDTMKDLNEVSGAALDRLLVDVYTEATDNQTGYWGKGVQRMVNVQVAVAKDILGLVDDETTVDAEIQKYRINDVRETVEVLSIANGNLPLIDHQESITAAGLADDPKVAFERIQEQQKQDSAQKQAAALAQREKAGNDSIVM